MGKEAGKKRREDEEFRERMSLDPSNEYDEEEKEGYTGYSEGRTREIWKAPPA